jgi:enamine deaminase RidA (YjgF/YER057c/UK114 family)
MRREAASALQVAMDGAAPHGLECRRTAPEDQMPDTIDSRLRAAGITLPAPPKPVATYVPYVIDGQSLVISGQLPFGPDGKLAATGKLGGNLTVEQGAALARLSAINILAQAKAALGDLERIRQLVKITAFVACTPDFTQHPAVVNGCSDLLGEILGERGRHTRSSVGAPSLPLDTPVEIEAFFSFD